MPRGSSFNYGFGLGRDYLYEQAWIEDRAWDPSLLRLAAWYDTADMGSVLTDNSLGITTLRDKSGNGRNATQNTSTLRPILTQNVINGYQGAKFDGVDDRYDVTLSLSACTVCYVAVLNQNTNSVYYPIGTGADQGVGNGGTFVSQAAVYVYNGVTTLSTSQTVTLNRPFLASANISTTGRLAGTNCETPVTDAASQSVSTLRIGARADGFWWWNGSIGEIVISNGILSTPDRQKLEGYLVAKWGFVQQTNRSQPFLNRPPLIGD